MRLLLVEPRSRLGMTPGRAVPRRSLSARTLARALSGASAGTEPALEVRVLAVRPGPPGRPFDPRPSLRQVAAWGPRAVLFLGGEALPPELLLALRQGPWALWCTAEDPPAPPTGPNGEGPGAGELTAAASARALSGLPRLVGLGDATAAAWAGLVRESLTAPLPPRRAAPGDTRMDGDLVAALRRLEADFLRARIRLLDLADRRDELQGGPLARWFGRWRRRLLRFLRKRGLAPTRDRT